MEKLPERPSEKHFGDRKCIPGRRGGVYGGGAALPKVWCNMTADVLPGPSALTPYILDRPAAYPPAQGVNAHLPYGLWVCPDGTQILFDRNYVASLARVGDGYRAYPVPLMPDGRGRWVQWKSSGYFFTDGEQAFLTYGKGRPRKAERRAAAHGERILDDFRSGFPVWRFIAKSDSMPVGLDRWRG